MTTRRLAPVPAAPISLRPLLFTVYVPATAYGVGMGAAAPVMTLTALDLGASPAVAGFTVALVGLGQVLGDIPAGQVVARLGERLSIIAASTAGVLGVLLCLLAPNVPVLCAGLVIAGLSNAIWGLARMSYLAEVVPFEQRARAMALFGGAMRLGFFLGPFLGAAAILGAGPRGGFLVQAVAIALAGYLMARLPDPETAASQGDRAPAASLLAIGRTHYGLLFTLGAGSLLMGAARSSREVVLPLWADHLGASAATASLVYGIGAGLDVLCAYPAGLLMDRYGRRFIAVPSLAILAVGFWLVPLTHAPLTLTFAAVILGIGNGIGNGVIMTIGADVAPAATRAEFLAAWRLTHDGGSFAGPLLISGLALAAPLTLAVAVVGGLAALGATAMARYIPVYIPWPVATEPKTPVAEAA
ncbi:MFS transporter [Nocardia yamanashiensis]|uniref:MFS transporter n=1 Tax=Nocardia yamanashiensis TaxID=209247 RepID=UPI001E2DBCCD|nr:MFS transporter [Nocardia yamanashiensis]UGT43124.1 MFS transporter [Nocardia yamanashiensis]